MKGIFATNDTVAVRVPKWGPLTIGLNIYFLWKGIGYELAANAAKVNFDMHPNIPGLCYPSKRLWYWTFLY